MYDDYDRYEDARDEARAERAPRRRRYRCGGYASYTGHCGATDCDTCYPGGCGDDEQEVQETTTSKVVTARKARPGKGGVPEIRVGDKVRVTSGFTYKPGGERLGYLPKRYTRVAKGPAWDEASTVH